MSQLPKTCDECRFYQGDIVMGADPKNYMHGCEILIFLDDSLPAYMVKNDEIPLQCPLATKLRFNTMCKDCMVEYYDADCAEERYGIKFPLLYNTNVALTLDYIGGRLGHNNHLEDYLQQKGIFGRKKPSADIEKP